MNAGRPIKLTAAKGGETHFSTFQGNYRAELLVTYTQP
jgi:hypothetical protein